mmetsp:Transcript_11377/g.25937  ORF Transcript_11377/g.25937 Transcript_11377/m.25937 type:complete len:202 (-) Transcript_11377:1503-2108(-)
MERRLRRRRRETACSVARATCLRRSQLPAAVASEHPHVAVAHQQTGMAGSRKDLGNGRRANRSRNGGEDGDRDWSSASEPVIRPQLPLIIQPEGPQAPSVGHGVPREHQRVFASGSRVQQVVTHGCRLLADDRLEQEHVGDVDHLRVGCRQVGRVGRDSRSLHVPGQWERGAAEVDEEARAHRDVKSRAVQRLHDHRVREV